MSKIEQLIAHLQNRLADAHSAYNSAIEQRSKCEMEQVEPCSDCDEEIMFATLDLHRAMEEQERLVAIVA